MWGTFPSIVRCVLFVRIENLRSVISRFRNIRNEDGPSENRSADYKCGMEQTNHVALVVVNSW